MPIAGADLPYKLSTLPKYNSRINDNSGSASLGCQDGYERVRTKAECTEAQVEANYSSINVSRMWQENGWGHQDTTQDRTYKEPPGCWYYNGAGGLLFWNDEVDVTASQTLTVSPNHPYAPQYQTYDVTHDYHRGSYTNAGNKYQVCKPTAATQTAWDDAVAARQALNLPPNPEENLLSDGTRFMPLDGITGEGRSVEGNWQAIQQRWLDTTQRVYFN